MKKKLSWYYTKLDQTTWFKTSWIKQISDGTLTETELLSSLHKDPELKTIVKEFMSIVINKVASSVKDPTITRLENFELRFNLIENEIYKFFSWYVVYFSCTIPDLRSQFNNFSKLYDIFCSVYLREIEACGLVVTLPKELKQEHHILPLSLGGSKKEPSNRVSVSIYTHGLAHAIRFLWSNHSTDLSGLYNGCRTLDEILVANKNRAKGSIHTTKNPEWQQTAGKRGLANKEQSVVTAANRAAGVIAGKKYQKTNSKSRVNPLTWFMSTVAIEFYNTMTSDSVIVQPNKDYYDCNSTVFVKQLNAKVFNDSLQKAPQQLSKLLSNTNKTVQNWSIRNIVFDDLQLDNDVATLEWSVAYSIAYDFVSEKYLYPDEYYINLYSEQNPIVLCHFINKIKTFLTFYEEFKAD